MTGSVSRKIERFARANGMSYSCAAAILGRRGAAAKRRKAAQAQAAEIEQERFEAMKAQRKDLYG